MFQIYLCVVCYTTHIPLGILGICFCNWVYCISSRFCVWLYFWRCLLIALVCSIGCITWMYNLQLQGFEWPFWSIFWQSCFLLLKIVFLLRISYKFLFRRKTILRGSIKTSSKSLFIFNIFQCLFTVLFISGGLRLHVSISGILLDVTWFFWFSRWALSIINVFEICWFYSHCNIFRLTALCAL